MKKLTLICALFFLFLFPISAGATPMLGVIDTDLLATVGGTVPAGEGFPFPNDGNITVWWGSDSGNVPTTADVWIVTNIPGGGTFTVGSTVYPLSASVTNKIDGYTQPYYAADLGDIGSLSTPDSPWAKADFSTAPDLTTGADKLFFLVEGVFSFSGTPTGTGGEWIFAVADINADGTTPDILVFDNGDDKFSPKTTSTAVPEPATMFLLGSGLIGLLGFARKKFKK